MRSSRIKMGFFVLVLLGLVVGFVSLYLQKRAAESGTPVTNERAGLAYRIPEGYQPEQITDAEREIGTVVKLSRSDPFALLTVRIDKNMPAEAALTKTKLADYVHQNVAELYRQYPDFYQVSTSSTKILGEPASELIFTYQGLDTKTRLTMDVVGLVANSKPYFFEFQTKETDLKSQQPAFRRYLKTLKPS